MENSIRSRTHCFLLCFANLIISSHTHTDQYLPENHVALFIFGDSIFDPGNNNYINTTVDFRANFWPYGETFFNYPTGRASDGRLIPDFVAQFAGLPIIPPYLKPGNDHKLTDGANFASGGAGALVQTLQGFVVDLETQVKYFFKEVEKSLKQELGDDAEANKLLSKAVYLFSIGPNDYSTRNSTASDEDQFVSMVLANLTAALKEIYKRGGRKFGFVNALPFGCSPRMRAETGGSCVENFTSIIKLHNERLLVTLKELEKQLEGFKFAYYVYQSFTQRLNNPSKYGFEDATTACCGSGPYRGVPSCGGKRGGITEFDLCKNVDQHLFFDSYHASEKAYRQFADLMWGGTADIVWPYNLKTLFQL